MISTDTDTVHFYEPVGSRIVVRIHLPDTTEGGVVLPNGKQPGNQRHGVVLNTGPGYILSDGTYKELQIKAGDKVYFEAQRCELLVLEGSDIPVAIMNADDVLLIERSR